MMDMPYDVLRKVGEGTFGEVFQGYHRETGEIVALKRIRIRNMQAGLPRNVIREIQALENIECKHVVSLKEYFPLRSSIVLVLDYMATDLHKVLDLCRTRSCVLPTKLIRYIMHMILTALKSIHDHFVIHRDIKPSNLLLSEMGILKLGDFGTCRTDLAHNSKLASATSPYPSDSNQVASESESLSGSSTVSLASIDAAQYSHEVGTRWYRSPELLFGARRYSRATDMWSVGCILGELLLGAPLFQGDNDIDQLYRIFKCVGSPTGVQSSSASSRSSRTNLANDELISKNPSGGKMTPVLQKRKSSVRVPLKQAAKAIDVTNVQQHTGSDAPKILKDARMPKKRPQSTAPLSELIQTANYWPEAVDLPDFAKIYFPEFMARSWRDILPSNTDALAIDLLSRLLVLDPTKRITPDEALRHPFFWTSNSESSQSKEGTSTRIETQMPLQDKSVHDDHESQSLLADLVICTLVDNVSKAALSKACCQGLRKFRQRISALPFRQVTDGLIPSHLFVSRSKDHLDKCNLKVRKGFVYFNKASGVSPEDKQCQEELGLVALSENDTSENEGSSRNSLIKKSLHDVKLLLSDSRTNSFLIESDKSDGEEEDEDSQGDNVGDSIESGFTILATVWSGAADDSDIEDSGFAKRPSLKSQSKKKKFSTLKDLQEHSSLFRRQDDLFIQDEDDVRSYSGDSRHQVPLNITQCHSNLQATLQEEHAPSVQFKPAFNLLKLNTNETDSTHPSMSSTPTVSELRKHRRNLSRSSELQTRRQSQPMNNPPDDDDRLVEMQTAALDQDDAKDQDKLEVESTTEVDTQSNSLGESRMTFRSNHSPKYPLCYLELKYLPRCPLVQIRTTYPNFKEDENTGLLVLKTTAQEQNLRGNWSTESLKQRTHCMDVDPQLLCAFTDITSSSFNLEATDEPQTKEQHLLPTDPGLFGDNKQLAADLTSFGLYSFDDSFDKKFEDLCLQAKFNSKTSEGEGSDREDFVKDTKSDQLTRIEPLWLPSSAFPISNSECQTYHNELLQSKLFDVIVNHPSSEYD